MTHTFPHVDFITTNTLIAVLIYKYEPSRQCHENVADKQVQHWQTSSLRTLPHKAVHLVQLRHTGEPAGPSPNYLNL